MHLDALRRVVHKGHGKPGFKRLSLHTYEWELHGDCVAPVRMWRHARKDRKGQARVNEWNPGDETPISLLLSSRCRQCAPCLRLRGRLWYSRAQSEIFRAARTWFGTLTLRPQEQFNAELAARAKLAGRAGVAWSSLTDDERFIERHQIIGEHLTRYLKRVRKERQTAFRYLIVAEAHKSGLPHYHLLVHEILGKNPLTKATLESQWQLGFSKWKLVEGQKMAGYVTKYIAKSAVARVRASGRYGQGLSSPKDERQTPPSGITFDVERVRKEMTPKTFPTFWRTLEQTWDEGKD